MDRLLASVFRPSWTSINIHGFVWPFASDSYRRKHRCCDDLRCSRARLETISRTRLRRDMIKVAAIAGGRYVDAYSKRVLVPSELQLLKLWAILFVQAFSRLAHGAAIGTDQAVARYLASHSGGLIAIDPYPVNTRLDGDW